MALSSRRQPTASSAPSRARPRTASSGGGDDTSRVGRLRGNIRDIMAELRKVTWPTREETRNLTIVVIGISAVIGILLFLLDLVLTAMYNGLVDIIR